MPGPLRYVLPVPAMPPSVPLPPLPPHLNLLELEEGHLGSSVVIRKGSDMCNCRDYDRVNFNVCVTISCKYTLEQYM